MHGLMFDGGEPGPHRPVQPFSPTPSSLQEQGEQTSRSVPVVAAVLGIILILSILVGLGGWAWRNHQRRLRFEQNRDVEKGAEGRANTEKVPVPKEVKEVEDVNESKEVKIVGEAGPKTTTV